MTIHHLQHIADLVEICRQKNLEHVVISPGSRNAPLTRLFIKNNAFTCHSIVDERSAAFYAMGISLGTGKPVAIVCTSGTAVLNYAPAIAEAFYEHVPLIVITADRPAHLIDQQDNQTIHQADVYNNYIKRSLNLNWPLKNIEQLNNQHTLISEIVNLAGTGAKGPVHINVPISEPLYEPLPEPSPFLKLSDLPESTSYPVGQSFSEIWEKSKRRMILCGQGVPNNELQQAINKISSEKQAVVVAEPISNIRGEKVISALERVMILVEQSVLEKFQPDLLISFGGPVVSKKLKQWLQKQPNLVHWRIAEENDKIDTYQNRKALITGHPSEVLTQISKTKEPSEEKFIDIWQKANNESFAGDASFFQTATFSDSSVFHFIMNNLPKEVTLHLGNSTPVRYAQMYNCHNAKAVFSNRGVSGIDGCLSTASGIACVTEGLHLVLIGDLSFVYDSNALWNRNLSEKLRIVVINNGGGGIFRLLQGPSKQDFFEDFIEAKHPVEIEKLAQAFDLGYFKAESQQVLEQVFENFIRSGKPSILEINTPTAENPIQFKRHLKNIKSI